MHALINKKSGCSLMPLFFLFCGVSHAHANETLPITNNLGQKVRAVYVYATGRKFVPLAGPIENAGEVSADAETLQSSRRLIVVVENGFGNGENTVQFFAPSSFGSVDALTLRLGVLPESDGQKVPVLSVEDGENRYAVLPGLPFDILESYVESGVGKTMYDELMEPQPGEGDISSSEFAVSCGQSVWSVDKQETVFHADKAADSLSNLHLHAKLSNASFASLLGALRSLGIEPLFLAAEQGQAVAFSPKGAEMEKSAELVHGAAGMYAAKRWQALFDHMKVMMNNDSFHDAREVRLAFASPTTCYEVTVGFLTREIGLSISKMAVKTSREKEELNILPQALLNSSEFVRGAALPDGTWWQERIIPDEDLLFEARRLKPLEFDNQQELRKAVQASWPCARDFSLRDFPAMTEKTTYPAVRFAFLTGSDNEARLHAGAAVYCEDWTFCFAVSQLLDEAAAGNGDSASAAETATDDLTSLLLEDVTSVGPDCLLGSSVKIYANEVGNDI